MKRLQKILVLTSIVLFLNPALHADESDNTNFRFGPVLLIIGLVDLNVDFRIAPNWTLGPTLTYWHFNLSSSSSSRTDYTVDAFGGGLRGNWFKNGVYTDGLYVGPTLGVNAVKIKTSDANGTYSGETTAGYLETVVGYAWFWNSFNMMLGGGLSVPLGDNKIKIRNSSGTDENVNYGRTGSLALEYSLGWTF